MPLGSVGDTTADSGVVGMCRRLCRCLANGDVELVGQRARLADAVEAMVIFIVFLRTESELENKKRSKGREFLPRTACNLERR